MDAEQHYDVFLSHAHEDRDWIEDLARRLEDEQGCRVWLDRWILIPGESFQQAMAKGLEEAGTCAVFLGQETPTGWFRQEIEHALNRQAAQSTFRVIPVLLPDASQDTTDVMPGFLDLRTWADFRKECDPEYAFHVLVQGIRGEPVGRWPVGHALAAESGYSFAERKLKQLRELTRIGDIPDVVATEYQQKILSRWLEDDA